MISTRTAIAYPLFERVKSISVLQRSWAHVRSSATSSRDPAVLAELGQIEQDSLRYLRRLQRQISQGTFVFAPQRGVVVEKDGKKPRPIVIASLTNRLVQRAILDVCQSDNSAVRTRLGCVPVLLATPTSVGGLPGKGVKTAIELIQEARSNGATHYVRSDIQDFFTRIKKSDIHAFLDREISDHRFVELFKRGLATDLANADKHHIVRHWSLFPDSVRGVPQGSSLSALCANIALADFDSRLNSKGITTVRYLDDFVILGRGANAVSEAWGAAQSILDGLGMAAHQPDGTSKKAARGTLQDGFDFLSFSFKGPCLAPTREAKSDLMEAVSDLIRASKITIGSVGNDPRRSQSSFAQSLVAIDNKVRGWGDAFRSTNQRVVFSQLDQRLDGMIDEYVAWFRRYQSDRDRTVRRRMWGIALLSDTPVEEPKPSRTAARA
jgi:RNA-directed DNA polymerase